MHLNLYNYILTSKDAISNYIYYLKKELENMGHKVDLICNHNEGSEKAITGNKNAIIKGVKTYFTKRVNWFNYSGYYPLIHLIKHVKGFKIFDYHCVAPPELWPYSTGKEFLIKGQKFKQYAKYADLIITHSKSGYDELTKSLKINKNKIMIRKYQLEGMEKKQVKKQKYSSIGLKKDDKVILYVGRVSPIKNLPVLIKSLKKVRNKNKKLVIIGKYDNEPYTTEYKKCLKIAEKEGVLKKALFLGQVSDEMLNDFYNLADVFVIPSKHEGFCIPVVEAMSVGTPVIGANTTALPETIGTAGLLFEPDDPDELAKQINKVFNNKRLREKLIKKGYEHYKNKKLKPRDIKRVLRRIKWTT